MALSAKWKAGKAAYAESDTNIIILSVEFSGGGAGT
jgi:hypothetical protein